MLVVVLALLLALTPAALPAQQGTGASGEGGTEAAAPAPTADQLVASTVAEDIATASYYELASWCLELGLDDSGSRPDLQARLAAHYGVTLPAPQPAEGKTVTVRSAREAEYSTDSASGEKYLSLRGDVVLEVQDPGSGNLQVIKAASLLYNRTRGTVSAQGNVTYTLTRGDQTDTFTGASLAFDLDTSQAVFYDGSNTRVVNRGGAGIPYTFRGATMSRLANDTVIVRDGTFTTSQTPDDPLYQIHTSTAWLLAPGEWAAQNALLMIGRVPVLYLPGFFWPGEEFVFNPNVGYKSREGSFVQTTTYLLGRKPSQQAPFSFLQLTSAGAQGYSLERHGLFLRKVPAKAGEKPQTSTLKLMLDAYSRLGVFAGIAGDFSPAATFRAGLAVSRDVFLDTSLTPPYYTPYLPDPVPGYTVGQSVWNSSTLLGLSVPFRFGLDGTLRTTGDVSALSAGFQYFSDPTFTSDFYSRSEAGILANLAPTQTSAPQQAASQNTLAWDLSGRLDFSRLVNSALVSTLSVPTIGAHMTWQSYPPPGSLSLVQQYDPGVSFYFPTSITAPNVSASVAGTILKIPAQAPQPPAAGPPSSTAPAQATPGDPGKGLRYPPVQRSAQQQAGPPSEASGAGPQARIPLRQPTPQPDFSRSAVQAASSLAVSYQVQPRATLEHTFDTQAWTTPQSVDYGIRYRTFETGGSSSVTAVASLFDRLLDINAGLAADGVWRARFDPSLTEAGSTDWQSLMLGDLQQDRLSLRSTLQGTLRPFVGVSSLSASTLQYQLGVNLYQLGYLAGSGTASPVFSAPALGWDTSTIAAHSLVTTLAFTLPWTSDSLAMTVQLPPLVPSFTGTLALGAGPVTGKLQGGLLQPPTGGVQYQPLVADLAADFGGGLTASQEVVVDLDTASATFQRSTSTIQLGPLSGAFIAQWMAPVNGLGNLIPGEPTQVLPFSARIGLETVSNPRWFWKDRIKVDLTVKTHWTVNIQQYTNNLFDFGLGLTVNIYKALDLTFSSYSTNNKTYRYIPGWPENLPDPYNEALANPLVDLFDSFAFWAPDVRARSPFKIRTLSVSATQHFPDWDLTFQYQGSPQLRVDPADGRQKYMWTPSFSIVAQWGAVPEFKTNIQGGVTGVTLR